MDLRNAIWKSPFEQQEVAKKAGCSKSLISEYICERSGLSKATAARIAKVLKCELRQGKTTKDWDFLPLKSPAKASA